MTEQEMVEAKDLIEEFLIDYEGEDFYDVLLDRMVNFITCRFEFECEKEHFDKEKQEYIKSLEDVARSWQQKYIDLKEQIAQLIK